MNRLVIMTVDKIHSGKTTFAKALEKEMHNSVVITSLVRLSNSLVLPQWYN